MKMHVLGFERKAQIWKLNLKNQAIQELSEKEINYEINTEMAIMNAQLL